jgi:hypothetical protein
MPEEQTETVNVAVDIADDPPAKRPYERSTIEFPYNDLDDAVEVVRAIHRTGGRECELDALAATLGLTITSGAFRGRVSNAGTFRLTDNERGKARLSDLGHLIIQPDQEAQARAEAFLSVPLYLKIFDRYKGFTLPPPAALERELMGLGVSSKQTDKARQAFVRSARQAGFFAHGEDRLVRPQLSKSPPTRPLDEPAISDVQHRDGRSGDGDGNPPLDPLIAALIQKLPPAGTREWKAQERIMWLQMAAMAFQMVYGSPGTTIEIKEIDAREK